MKLGTAYLKASDCNNGDRIKILNAGNWVENAKFKNPDGSPKRQLQFEVETMNGDVKTLSMNKTSRDFLTKEWGTETDDWVGKVAIITVMDSLVSGKAVKVMVLNSEKE